MSGLWTTAERDRWATIRGRLDLAGIGFLAFAFCRKCDFLFAGGFILEWM